MRFKKEKNYQKNIIIIINKIIHLVFTKKIDNYGERNRKKILKNQKKYLMLVKYMKRVKYLGMIKK